MNGGYEAHARGAIDTEERFVDTYLAMLGVLYQSQK